MPRAVVLTGPPASGKTTLGQVLAAMRGVGFIDIDAEITRSAGCTVAELFARYGEAAFRERERAVFAVALRSASGAVFAAGGGSLLDPGLRMRALRVGWVVGLSAPTDLLVERVTQTAETRPLLSADPGERVQALLAARANVYAEAHVHIDTSGRLDDLWRRATRAVDDLERQPTLLMPLGSRSYLIHVGSA